LFILYSTTHAVTIFFYRILQASIASSTNFLILGIVHGFIGTVERIVSIVYKRDILSHINSRMGRRQDDAREETPREKRVSADGVIVGFVYEMWGIVATNCMLLLYSIQHRIPHTHGEGYAIWGQLRGTLIRIVYSLLMEYVFVVITVWVLTWKCNMPINLLWRSKWKRLTVVLVLNASFVLLLTSSSMVKLSENSYRQHLIERGDEMIANQLSQCNFTTYPY
jgi:hypothetical protein